MNGVQANPMKFAAGRFSARARIVVGQVLLLIGVLLLAVALGILPNERRAILAGRSSLCEAVAVECAASIQRGDYRHIDQTLAPMLRRDPTVLSAIIRRADGTVIAQFGEEAANVSTIAVPIWANDRKWGGMDVHFIPVQSAGWRGFLSHPAVGIIAFVSLMCAGLYLLYLRKMLQHLDPSKVVPPRVRSALDTLAEGLVVLDGQHRVVLANRAFADIIGKEPDEMLGVHISHFPWESSAAWDAAQAGPWLAAMETQQAIRGVVMRLRDRKSIVRTFCVNCSPVLGGQGESRGVLISLDDITQLERNEAELRKSKEEAQQASRAKSEFLARISHEIRTPMNAILGFADILRRGYEQNDAERIEFLETIHSSGQHLLELINDILDLSKIEAGRLQFEISRCSPHALICEVVSVLQVRALQKGIGLEFRWDGKVPQSIQTDPTRLRQAITNLVGNAVKFTETGGVEVIGRMLTDGDMAKVQIQVSDSGIGIDPAAMDRIFQPFAQADTSITRRFGGTGLGLSISRQIVEGLGGGIEVQSEVGRGTVFTLTVGAGSLAEIVLLDPEQAESNQTPHPQAFDAKLAGVRALVAEDGASNVKFISLVLGRAGVILESARDGSEACELAGKNSYDVILMDMQMPVMDGYTAAATLRKMGITTPIIALTAHAMRGDEEKCRAAGCTGFLTKPIDMDLLVKTLAEAIGARQELTPANANGPAVTSNSAYQSNLPTDDPEFCQLVEEFIIRLREQVGAIGDAWTKGDLSELALLAHWIKGSGGTAGFPVLTAPARNLEDAVRDNRLDEIAASIAELQDLAGRLISPTPVAHPISKA